MTLFKMFKSPYLDGDNGANLGGGAEPTPTPTPEPTPEPTPAPKGNEPTPEPQKLKIKYNHEEKEISVDEARELAQKGLNYDKAVERAKQEAIDTYIANQGYEWNGKPITTEAEYKQALYEKELQDKGQDPNEVKKLINEHPDVKAAREYRETQEKEARQKADFVEFFTEFPDVKAVSIPAEVWAENAKGKPLADAYARYLLKQQKSEAAKAAANKANADTAMGSVGSNGNTDTGLTEETINAHSNDTKWMMQNYKKVEAFYAKKKG